MTNKFIVIGTAAFFLALAAPARAQRQGTSTVPIITTVAGCCESTGAPGTAGYSGDGGPATSAELDRPWGVAVAATGDLYIADSINSVIRKVTASTGIIATVAGGGSCGSSYCGDGGPATSAELHTPYGVAMDAAGNLYIADWGNNVIRKVAAATGVITTVAGCCESTGGIAGYGGDGGPATSASLHDPIGVAVDTAGNFYIADTYNCLIRKVTVATGMITTVAGNTVGAGSLENRGYTGDGGSATSAEVAEPNGIALDAAGNLYVADTLNNVVRKVTASTGIITTVVGNGYGAGTLGDEGGYTGDGGTATSAELYYLRGVAVDSADNLYIADSGNYVVRMVTAASGLIATVSGCCETDGASGIAGYLGDGGPATSAEMNSPLGIAVDSKGNFYTGDISNNVVRKVTVPARTATTTTLNSLPNPSNVGESVTFNATVSGSSSPTGTVSFTANGATISGCGAIILASGTAQCSTTFVTVGSYSIVASYSGDTENGSSSGILTQVVTLAATTTTVNSSLNPSQLGESVTLTATVAPAGSPTPTGTVSFTSLGTAISGCADVTLDSSSTAECTTSSLPVGTDAVVATYPGDSNYSGSSGTFSQLVNPIPTPVQFIPVTPCRIVDTRGPDGYFGGPELTAGETRNFTLPVGPCAGIPSTAAAYSLNVTVVPPAPLGYLTIWPTGAGQPTTSTLNSLDGRTKANAAIVPAGTGGAVSVHVNNTTNVLLDINGYFEHSNTSTLQFYPLPQCRVADTRKAAGPLGGPELAAATERDFPILSSTCSIPDSAKAYSLNFTAIPPTGGTLAYLTVWPEGEIRPLVSTLNDPTGTVVANAAIVPAGTSGGVAVYPSDATNLAIDVNGYFAPAGTGGLQLYALTPCRVLDTRKTTGAFSNTTLVVNVAGSACAPPSAAQGYVFNATVVPTGDLGYLTLWPDGETQPIVSTLNAEDAAITSNMAIVPNKDGKTDAYASGTTQLILDISAYFAP